MARSGAHAPIRQMNEIMEGLWISDIQAAKEEDTERFDTIVSVCPNDVKHNISSDTKNPQFRLADAPPRHSRERFERDNRFGKFQGTVDYAVFANAAMTTLVAWQAGDAVLVHCHAGVSRSAAVCSAVVGCIEELPLEDALDIVADARPKVRPCRIHQENAARFINERTDIPATDLRVEP